MDRVESYESKKTINNFSSSEDEDFSEDSDFYSDDYDDEDSVYSMPGGPPSSAAIVNEDKEKADMKNENLSVPTSMRNKFLSRTAQTLILSDSEDENDVFT